MDILNNQDKLFPDLSYKPVKRNVEEFEAFEAKEKLKVQEKKSKAEDLKLSRADYVAKRCDEALEVGLKAEETIDEICKHIEFTVDQENEPFVYNALKVLFGDDFDGIMTYSMYSKLLKVQSIFNTYNVDRSIIGG